jgi:hypothetical protein
MILKVSDSSASIPGVSRISAIRTVAPLLISNKAISLLKAAVSKYGSPLAFAYP